MNNISQKKVLIICSFFFPDTCIAAVRMSNFAINLKKSGYDVTVLCYGKIHQTIDLSLNEKIKGIKIVRVYNLVSDKIEFKSNKLFGLVSKFFNKLVAKFFIKINIAKNYYHEQKTSKIRIEEMKNKFNDMKQNDFDIVLATYSLIDNLYVAQYVSEICGCPYIIDLRDGISQNTAPYHIEKKLKKLQDEFINDANAVIFNSEPLKNNCIKGRSYDAHKLFVINNGYEKIELNPIDHKEMTLCHTGNAFYKWQSFDPIFKSISNLSNKGFIDKKNVRFLHAGLAGKKFEKSAKKFGLSDVAIDFGYVDSKAVLDIQASSDIFVNLVWNIDEYSSGNINGKFFEGFKNELPILVISTGKFTNCYLKQLNDKYNYGFVYEEAAGDKAQVELENYILDCYNKKMNGEKILDPYPEDLKNMFEYSNLTKKLINVIDYAINSYKNDGANI